MDPLLTKLLHYNTLVTATDIKSSADNVITASSSASIQPVLLVSNMFYGDMGQKLCDVVNAEAKLCAVFWANI